MIDPAMREKVARLAAQRLAQKRKGVRVIPVILAVRKELIPDRRQTSRFNYRDLGRPGNA